MTTTGVEAALSRAGLVEPRSAGGRSMIDLGLARIGAQRDEVLEVTETFWATETHGGDGYALLTREGLCMVLKPLKAGGILRRREASPVCVPIPFTQISDLIENDEDFEGAAIGFIGKDGGPDYFILRSKTTAERDRFFPLVFAAHRGNMDPWRSKPEPEALPADFHRHRAELVATGITDDRELRAWLDREHGEPYYLSGLALAAHWRSCELSDAEGRSSYSSRVTFLDGPYPWIDQPEARRVLLGLGEELFDAGLLAPPYDERSHDEGDPLSRSDIGPRRLCALMSTAALARELRDPRADELVEAARPYLRAVPAAVFSEELRERWATIEPLPEDDGPRELEPWEDSDVRDICTFGDGQVSYDTSGLTDTDRAQIDRCFAAVPEGSADGADHVRAALAGVAAFEELSPMCPSGWRKLVVLHVSEAAHRVWRASALPRETALLAQWVTSTIETHGWGPDGNASPCGQNHSYCMHLASETGIGIIVRDPVTGLFVAPTGDEARDAARRGIF